MEKIKDKNIDDKLDAFLGNEDCTGDKCIIKGDKSIVEVVRKKIVTEDGRQLLI
jgi:hypothetical protein